MNGHNCFESTKAGVWGLYRAPQKIPTGTVLGTGVTFDVAGHEGSVGWPDMGKVTIVADPDPFGLGSLFDPFGSSGGKGYPQGNL